MFKKIVITISFVFMIPMMIFGQNFDLNSFKNSSMNNQNLMYNMQQNNNDDIFVEDSVRYDYVKSPAKAFAMSLILPGAGELYTGKWGRAIGFMGMEALFWGMHFSKNNLGEEIEIEYKEDADEQWDFTKWLDQSSNYDVCGPDGSHQIWAILKVKEDGNWVMIDETAFEVKGSVADVNAIIDSLYIDYNSQECEIVPIKTRDYYENIGKYRQFGCGWNDFAGVEEQEGKTSKIISENRNKYLNKRKDSNDALKLATQYSTAIIVNHIISAFHAQILAKHYEPNDVSWNMNLMTDVRQKYLINGVNFSMRF